MKKVTLIPGDGIGYEISESLVEIFKAAKVPVEFETENVKKNKDYTIKETPLIKKAATQLFEYLNGKRKNWKVTSWQVRIIWRYYKCRKNEYIINYFVYFYIKIW